MYRNLDSEKILGTIETLNRRIAERFPGAGLARVCQELLTIAEESHRRSAWIAKPQRSLRILAGAVVMLIIGGLVFVLANASWPNNGFDLVVLVQVSEAGLNVFLLLSAAILFLITAETRIKRRRALKAIHE